MKNLKNKCFIFAVLTLTIGCQSLRVFQIDNFDDLHVITTNANRVNQKCVFLDAEAENKWRHQYVMYLLDDRNQAIEVLQSTHMDKDSCLSQVNEVQKVLKHDRTVKVCVRDKLVKLETSDSKRDSVLFGPLGSHSVAFNPLTFDTICNSKKCVGDNAAWVKTCPGFAKH